MESNTDQKFEVLFGILIKTKRKEKKISQKELAERFGTHKSSISKLEHGEVNPSLFWCYRLSNALEIDFAVLMTEFSQKVKEKRID